MSLLFILPYKSIKINLFSWRLSRTTSNRQPVYKLKEPWDGFLKSGDVHCGREKRSLLELLKYTIKQPEAAQKLLQKIKNSNAKQSPLREKIIF